MRRQTYSYQMPATTSDDAAGNLAVFLTLNTGSCLGRWIGHMRAVDQRALFNQFLGKGRLEIDGQDETVAHVVKVAFGGDWTTTDLLHWRDLCFETVAD